MTKSFLKRNNAYTSRWIVLMIDIAITLNAFFLAYLTRFNFKMSFSGNDMVLQLPYIAVITLISFLLVGSL